MSNEPNITNKHPQFDIVKRLEITKLEIFSSPLSMTRNSRKSRSVLRKWSFPLVLIALFVVFIFQLWVHATKTSVTIDEPPHILSGYRYWRCADFATNTEHPPLLKLLATLPLKDGQLDPPPGGCGIMATGSQNSIQALTFLAQNGIDPVVVPARLAASLMSIALAVLIFVMAREMFGRAAALLSLGILVFEPNIIAHGSLVTTDVPLATTALAAVYALYRYRQASTWTRWGLLGLGAGLALAAKHTGVLVLPLLVLLWGLDMLFAKKWPRKEPEAAPANESHLKKKGVSPWLREPAAFVGMGILALAVLWACYGFRYRALPDSKGGSMSVIDILQTSPNPNVLTSFPGRVIRIANRFHLVPEAYNAGLAEVVAAGSRPTFILGKGYPTGQKFYFPLAFVVKSSIPLLLLLGLALVTPALYSRYPRELMFLLIPPISYFGFALTAPLNIGVRHIMPIYPFLIIVAAAGAMHCIRKYRVAGYVVAALLLYHAGTAARAAPDYLAFANDFWGGTKNNHRIFLDSNVEWGQNLKAAAAYLQQNKPDSCWFAVYGNGPLVGAYYPCRLMPAFGWNSTDQVYPAVPRTIEGTILLSVTVLPPRGGPEYLPVVKTEPVALLGGSILVYRGRFDVPLVAALSHMGRVDQLVRLKRYREAVADARKAVALAPDDPRIRMSLGIALGHAGDIPAAKRELALAGRLAQRDTALFVKTIKQINNELKRLETAAPPK